jgi:hypothetical protein
MMCVVITVAMDVANGFRALWDNIYDCVYSFRFTRH